MTTPKERLKAVFHRWDKNNDGYISPDELCELFRALDMGLPEDKVVECFAAVDKNKDGKLDINEFIEFLYAPAAKPVRRALNIKIKRAANAISAESSHKVVLVDEPMFRITEVTTMSGTVIAVDPPLLDDDAVDDLRLNVASALHVGVKQVVLTCGSEELRDGQLLADAIGNTEDVAISATVQSPDVYIPNIVLCAEGGRVLAKGWGRDVEYALGRGDRRPKSWVTVKRDLTFPPPNGINVNMMPFRMGDVMSISEELQGYWPIIEACCEMQYVMDKHRAQKWTCERSGSENKKIWFLTVHESTVAKGTTQRRGGLHIEAPGVIMSDGGRYKKTTWCWGEFTEDYGGGFYMASNVSNSCRVFNARITDHPDVVGPLGELEHIRTLLPEGHSMEAGELVWLTDKTPHEALPVAEDCARQFIRIVTSSVSAWYDKHSTQNPLGIKPDPAITRIVTGDKFDAIRDRVSQSAPISNVLTGEQADCLPESNNVIDDKERDQDIIKEEFEFDGNGDTFHSQIAAVFYQKGIKHDMVDFKSLNILIGDEVLTEKELVQRYSDGPPAARIAIRLKLKRAEVGDFVVILDTTNTRKSCPHLIGAPRLITTDDASDWKPYKVEECDRWLFRKDVRLVRTANAAKAEKAAEEAAANKKAAEEAERMAANKKEAEEAAAKTEAVSRDEIYDIFLRRYKMSWEELQGMADRMGIQLRDLCYIKQVFDTYDEDRSGYIEVNELKDLLEKLGKVLSEGKVDQAVHELDIDGSGEIEFFEFVEWFISED